MKRSKKSTTAPTELSLVLTVREVSEYLHVHPTTVYRLLRSKQIPGFRVGSDWRFGIESIDRWVLGKGVQRLFLSRVLKESAPEILAVVG